MDACNNMSINSEKAHIALCSSKVKTMFELTAISALEAHQNPEGELEEDEGLWQWGEGSSQRMMTSVSVPLKACPVLGTLFAFCFLTNHKDKYILRCSQFVTRARNRTCLSIITLHNVLKQALLGQSSVSLLALCSVALCW
jgi:hypothetical protein